MSRDGVETAAHLKDTPFSVSLKAFEGNKEQNF